jgi:hypothetical protein
MLRRAWLAATGTALLGACVSPPHVQTLATGRPDVSAWALQGEDLDQLRRTAQRLCPLGGEIVRQSARGQRPEPADGALRQALQSTAQWFDEPQRSAQLVLLCREAGDRMRLAPTPAAVAQPTDTAAPAQTATSAGEITAGLPVGPVMPEW